MNQEIINKIAQIIGESINGNESQSVAKIKRFIRNNIRKNELIKKILLITLKIQALPTTIKSSHNFQSIVSLLKDNNLNRTLINEFETRFNNYIQNLDTNTRTNLERNLAIDSVPDFDINSLDINALTTLLERNINNATINPVAEITETISENMAQLNEIIEDEYSHLLSIFLKRMGTHLDEYIDANRPNETKIEIKDDENGETINFDNEERKIGNRSSVIYKNTVNDEINNKVTSNVSQNKIIITHKKDSKVYKSITNDCFFSVIDYMDKNNKVPFTFNINGKSESYLSTIYETLFKFSDEQINTLRPEERQNTINIKNKISKFKINNIEISMNFITSCHEAKDIKTEIERLRNAMLNQGTANINNANNMQAVSQIQQILANQATH